MLPFMTKRIVRWKDEWRRPGMPRDVAVWVDVAALDAAWQLDASYYLPPGSPNSRHKYVAFGEWFATTREWVGMPVVGMTGDAADFTNGRHRFAWMRDHGVEALPVACGPGEADDLRGRFRTSMRVSRLR